ncbi:beta-galactosidase [Metapseudomonas resinovorans]|uniref:Putative glycosidase n=1 Tax=Metapseudomonas resinovorans NBRC 106553 TaxID=1245471 RepID=S6ANX6_METRE|nr:beta-galactosidase [Pseudomonas resinovorans]BAN47328.1 putative glycosidase [Pseudomonas resinovorans NBRC 106553]
MLSTSKRPLALAILLGLSGIPLAVQAETLFNFVRPLDAVQVTTQDASLPSLTAESTANGEILRRLTFNAAEKPSLRLTPQSGSWDWSKSEAMSLRIQSAQDWAITLDVTIESTDGKVLTSQVALPAGPAQTLLVPLAATSPNAHGMRAAPPVPWTRDGQRWLPATLVNGELDRSKVASVTLSLNQPNAAQNVLLGRFGTAEDNQQQALYAGLIDAYGQSTRGDWPGKVKNDEQLKKGATDEAKLLADWTAKLPQQDAYGGMLGGETFEASGFFRTEKRHGRWFLVTPEGHPFFSLGVNAVTPSLSQTYVEGRESMFTALPKDNEPLARYFGKGNDSDGTDANKGRAYNQGRWYDFYGANLERTYGGNDPQRWAEHGLDRLKAWGFNTIGNWSDPAFSGNKRMPYTLPLSIHGDFAVIKTGFDWWGGMPDPFDPRFAMAAERAIAIAARDHRDDPWLLGYFADNELAWGGHGSDPKARYALAYGTLRLTTDVPAKRAFLKQLRDKYRNQQGLSKAWGIELPAWELMEDPGFEPPLPSPEFPSIEEDFQRFQRFYADTYFKTIADSMKWHAPNHLLLGGRFAATVPEAIEACAQYCDVLSFNRYTREPQHGLDMDLLRRLDKPLMITEFHFGSRDRGPFWGGVAEVYKAEERGPAYANFVKKAAEEPLMVGAHYFQYLDQPASGRLLDGENGHIGLVGITDRPWQGFVDAVHKANLAVVGDIGKAQPGSEPAKAVSPEAAKPATPQPPAPAPKAEEPAAPQQEGAGKP